MSPTTNAMRHPLLPPTALLLALAFAPAANGCAKGLASLSPFPCAMDGTCPDGFTCVKQGSVGGSCYQSLSCPGGQTQCGEACVDVSSDAANCGGCGQACAAGSTCCNGACADLASDAAHCGSCGNACQNAKSCLSGTCACTPEQTTCAGDCADLKTDLMNCGSCGHACSNGYCLNGFCHSCKPYEQACATGCVTNTDPNNCGGCGNSCNGQPCTGGTCGSNTCNGMSYTCATAGDIWYCGSTTGGCCKAQYPYFCDNAQAPCWSTQIDCSTIVGCGGSYYGCPTGQHYDCGAMSCM